MYSQVYNIQKQKKALMEYVSKKRSTIGEDLFDLIKSLPNRNYTDSAEVAVAFGELKSGKGFRSAKQAEVAEQPSKKGGKAAARESVSAAAVTAVILKSDKTFGISIADLKCLTDLT
jgi:hypothetical protein